MASTWKGAERPASKTLGVESGIMEGPGIDNCWGALGFETPLVWREAIIPALISPSFRPKAPEDEDEDEIGICVQSGCLLG